MTRVLALMGSGETSPTMVKVHRTLLERLGPSPRAVYLDTPYGFQENADQLGRRIEDYFDVSLSQPIIPAPLRRPDGDLLAAETALARIRSADYVFSGPGSPTYALRVWRSTAVPELLGQMLLDGGVVTLASAAALTAGTLTIPVYEVYKVGADPFWEPGLDLLGPAGIRTAVVPHFDNAEGGDHDTRFCWMGKARFELLVRTAPPDVSILGIDEHTAWIGDLDTGEFSVEGKGGVTIIRDGRSERFQAGSSASLDRLRSGSATNDSPYESAAADRTVKPTAEHPGRSVRQIDEAFHRALEAEDAGAAAAAALELDRLVASRAGTEGAEAHRALRAIVVQLGGWAATRTEDPAARLREPVERLLEVRERARSDGRFDTADAVRDALAALDVVVRDTADGPTWEMAP